MKFYRGDGVEEENVSDHKLGYCSRDRRGQNGLTISVGRSR